MNIFTRKFEEAPDDGSSDGITVEEIEAILTRDPFAQASAQDTEDDGQQAAAGEGETDGEIQQAADTEGGTDGSSAGATTEGQSQTQPAGLDETTLLKAKVAFLEQQAALAAQQRPAAAPVQQQQQDDELPAYQFQLPVELRKLLDSEDAGERAQGMQYALQGLARLIHSNLREEYRGYMKSNQPDVASTVQTIMAHRQQQQEIFNDFYGAYKDLNHPALHQVVLSVGQQVYKEHPGLQYNNQVRDEIARRTYAILGRQMPKAGKPAAARKGPAMVGSQGGAAARPNGAAAPNSVQGIFQTLF